MGGFFNRGDIVVVDDGKKRWSVDRIREEYRKSELVQVADLSDVDDGTRLGVLTDRLTKVAG